MNQWTDDELKKAVIAYFKMLRHEQNKTPYVKKEINKELQKELANRTRASIEYRWQNISAVLLQNKLPYVNGYKPATNVGANVSERIWKIIIDLKLL